MSGRLKVGKHRFLSGAVRWCVWIDQGSRGRVLISQHLTHGGAFKSALADLASSPYLRASSAARRRL